MKIKNNNYTRRDFIKDTGCAAIGLSVGLPALADEIISTREKSKVVLIRHKQVINSKGQVDKKIIAEMLDQAMLTLFETDTSREAWKMIIKPEDIVGIKSNEWGPLPTPDELEEVLKLRLMEVGVKNENIGIDDRNVLNNDLFLKSTALINIRPMRTHAWSGVGSLIKNYIMFSPNPPDYHDNSCMNLGALWIWCNPSPNTCRLENCNPRARC